MGKAVSFSNARVGPLAWLPESLRVAEAIGRVGMGERWCHFG